MLRAFFLSLSKASWAQRLITRWGFAWKAASRFVAGETREDALNAVRRLNAHGINATLDNLGEHTSSPEEAAASSAEVVAMLQAIQAAGVRSNVSVKLTQLGLAISPELCRANLLPILQAAQSCGNFVRIDMEDSSLTQVTLDMLGWAHEQGFTNTGIVIQAYLYRSEQDVRDLMEKGIRVRLCKGAYREPGQVAFPKKKDVDSNYDHLVALMLTHVQSLAVTPVVSVDGRIPPLPAVASHDPRRIQFAQALAQKLGLQPGAVEFQMLYGIRRDLQQQLAAAGYQVRVYVPYGTHWYPYFLRRLAERPANVWFILSNLFKD